MKPKIYHIVAVDKKYGMGKDGKLPWHLKKEMAYFQNQTTRVDNPVRLNMVIMGRSTWESIPESHRPLPGRVNVIMTRNKDYKAEGAEVAHSLKEAMNLIDEHIETVYIIGGAKVFQETITRRDLEGVYLTVIDKVYNCDTRYPRLPRHFKKKTRLGADEEDGVKFEYLLITRK